jgi:hypothetical protein
LIFFVKINISNKTIEFFQYTVLAVDNRHVAFCEYNGSVARIICVAVATLANEKRLERASDNDLIFCIDSTATENGEQ